MEKILTSYVDIEVPFFDVDSYRIVWHGNYAKYFEIARCQLLEEIAYPYSEMELTGYAFPVIELQTKYVKSIVFKQKIRVRASLRSWQHKLEIDYLITDQASGERLTKGRSTQVAVSMPDQVTQFQSPDVLISAVEQALKTLN